MSIRALGFAPLLAELRNHVCRKRTVEFGIFIGLLERAVPEQRTGSIQPVLAAHTRREAVTQLVRMPRYPIGKRARPLGQHDRIR